MISEKHNKNKRLHQDFRRYMTWKGTGQHIKKYLGVEVGGLREWIEGMFTEEMNWDNYGSVWVVDHIVPIRMFDIFDEEQLRICWHYKNLMPLLKEDNFKKEGNVFFSYEILLKLKDRDHFYQKLFNIIEPEVLWMIKYIETYNKKWDY